MAMEEAGPWEVWSDPKDGNYLTWLPDHVFQDIIDLLPPFLEKYRNRDSEYYSGKWDWYQLTLNPGISLEYIEQHSELPWNWGWMLERKDMTWEFYLTHFQRFTKKVLGPHYIRYLCEKPFVLPQYFCEPHRSPSFWQGMSSNPNINLQMIEENIVREWIWGDLSSNPVVTPAFILKHGTRDWDWDGVSLNPNLTLEFIEDNVSRLNMPAISKHPVITIDFVLKHIDYSWDFNSLSRNPSITLTNILSTREISEVWERWNWNKISSHQPNIEELMNSHPELPWRINCVHSNPSLSDEYRETYLFDSPSRSKYCDPWLVERFPHLEWRWDYLSQNPRIMSRW
jgi:hypothetical protein